MEEAIARAVPAGPAKQAQVRGKNHGCYLCGADFFQFIPFRGGSSRSALLNNLALVDCDLQRFFCQVCGCHGRERHLCMYFDALRLWDSMPGAAILHFGPYEKTLVKRIGEQQPARYVRADLYPPSADVEKVDVTRIPYPDEYFDFILCCHVLEHVPDDDVALRELFRVLKPGGCAVLQTPFSRTLRYTWEDPGIASPELRLLCYGQEDHVRLYGLDFFDRIRDAGFMLQLELHRERLPGLHPNFYGVNEDEELILARK